MLLTTSAVDEEPADSAVIEAVLQGRTALFEILIRRHGERAFRAARAMTTTDEDAERVVEQAL
jgi:hypothetical protein